MSTSLSITWNAGLNKPLFNHNPFVLLGAGIYVSIGVAWPYGSLPNNGLLVSMPADVNGSHRFRFFCRSDSTTENVGQFVGLNGSIITGNKFFSIDHFNLPGQLVVGNTVGFQDALPITEQGVYTCRIPLKSTEIKEINIGIYPYGFSSES